MLCFLLFFVYLLLVLYITGIWEIPFYVKQNGFSIRPETINPVPFRTEGFSLLMDRLNIELFVPLGFFLPTLFPRFRMLWSVALSGFLFSLTIELLQLLSYRVTDVDDLLMNTLGAVIGYFGFFLFYRLSRRFRRASRRYNPAPRRSRS